ncbi:MAG: transcriptional repressor LexA [Plectolyngbya sp. WJT66-NPBG17]|jgi:repressor LexA|nr:transcriptional repressor LexA [Plectolyngbya sp. WJT66-NPBG17]MBW4526937.1 transcriptional repressor LexA [Phormidium tanganyikae FI6-MK23]
MTDLSPPKQKLLDWLEDYVDRYHSVPSYGEMAAALGYKSKDTIRFHLTDLRDAGYVAWKEGSVKSLVICKPRSRNIPILGMIAAGGLLEMFAHSEIEEYVDVSTLPHFVGKRRHQMSQYFALRVRGDSMIGAAIADGDVVILRKESEPNTIKNGEIVAARFETQTTLKHLFWSGDQIILQPANPSYPVIEKQAEEVAIEGIFVGLVRGLV